MKDRITKWDGVGLSIWVLLVLYMSILERRRWGVDISQCIKDGLYYGSLLYGTIIIPTCWIFVKKNKAVIYQEIGYREKEPLNEIEATDTITPPKGLIVMLPGPHFRIPFLHQQYREPIDLVIEKPLTEKITVYDANNQAAELTWLCNKNPVRGEFLPNFYLVRPEIAEPYLSNVISDRIAEVVRKHSLDWAIEDRRELNKDVEMVLGGIHKLSDEEKQTGRNTGQIVVSNITPTADSLAVASAAYRMKKAREEAALNIQLGMDPNLAMSIAARAHGIDVNVINLAGMGGAGAVSQPVGTTALAALLLSRGQAAGAMPVPPP